MLVLTTRSIFRITALPSIFVFLGNEKSAARRVDLTELLPLELWGWSCFFRSLLIF